MKSNSILGLEQIKELIENIGALTYESKELDIGKFEVGYILSEYFKMDLKDIYEKIVRKKSMEYTVIIKTKKYEIISDWEIKEDIKEKMIEKIRLKEGNKEYIFITKSIIEKEIKMKGEVIDFQIIIENIMNLKSVADEVYLNYEDYKKSGMTIWKGARALFINPKHFIDENEDEIKKEDVFSYNVRGDEGGKKVVAKSIIETIKKKDIDAMLGNNGIVAACEKIIIKDDIKKVILKNVIFINGGQTLRILHKNREILTENMGILLKIMIVGEQGGRYLDKIAKISNRHIPIKNKELNSNLEKYYYLNKVLSSESIPKRFRKEVIHKIGQVPKGMYITKQEIYMLEIAFKYCIFEFEAMKREIEIINEATAKEIIVLDEIRKFLVDEAKKELNRYKELKEKYTEKRLHYQIYYLSNVVLHSKRIINSPKKREDFIENVYEKLIKGKSIREIIGDKVVSHIMTTISLYMNYRLAQKENNDKFRRGLNEREKKIFFEYMRQIEKIFE